MFLYVKGHWKFGIMLRLNKKRVESKELPKPANKSYEVGSNVHNKLNIAVIIFFCSVPSILQPFLLNFQTDKPMVPFLDVDLFSVFKTLMRKFIKPEVLDSTQTSIKLLRIDVNDKSNQVNYKKINIGLLLNKASENQKQVKGRLWNLTGARCSSVVRAFAHGAMGCRINSSLPMWWQQVSSLTIRMVLNHMSDAI